MKRKLIALFLATTMVAGLAGCGGSETASTNSGSTDSAASTTTKTDSSASSSSDSAAPADTAAIDTSEHVVITYMTTGDKPTGTAEELDKMLAELNKILTEKVNAELDIYFIEWTDYLSNYNLTLAQMDGTVDLVGTASDWLDAWPNAKNGAFLELSEDMLKTYAPQTWASVPAENWELCKYDGEIYLMPEDNYAQWTNHGYIYRMDWAKEAGLANGVQSWEDLTTYWKHVKATYSDIIPWDSDGTHQFQMASGWVASHSNFVPIDGLSNGGLWGGTKDDLYTITSPFVEDTEMMVEYAKLMKEWNEIGVWKTDVLNNTSADARADFRIGRSAADQHHSQTWTDLCSATPSNTIYETDEDAEAGFFYFGQETDNVVALSITHGAMAISAGSENPERALMVYDLIRNDPECYRLFNYGIEGTSYAIDENGYRITPEGFDSEKHNINGTTNYWWGRNDDLEIKDATRNWDAIDKLYAEYDKIKINYPYGQFVPDVDNIQSYINNVNETHNNYMKQISYGLYQGTAEEIVAEYQEAMKAAGFDEVVAELQRQFDELYK